MKELSAIEELVKCLEIAKSGGGLDIDFAEGIAGLVSRQMGSLERQIEAVDEALPRWKGLNKGRIDTIRDLVNKVAAHDDVVVELNDRIDNLCCELEECETPIRWGKG